MKTITFNEARKMMKPGDVFIFNKTHEEAEKTSDNFYEWSGGETVLLNDKTLDATGHIKPHERVMSAEECIEKYRTEEILIQRDLDKFEKQKMVYCFEHGDRNGQLKRDLQLRPIIEAVRKCEYLHSEGLKNIHALIDAIPPLYGDEQ